MSSRFLGSRRLPASRLAVAIGAATLAIALAASSALATPGWSTPKLRFAARFGPVHSTAVDSQGYLHIVAEGGAAPGLWYISNAPADGDPTPSWFVLQLTNKEDHNPSLAIFEDRIYVAFERHDPGTLASKGIWTVTNKTGTFVVKNRHLGNDHDPSITAKDGDWHVSFRQGSALKYISNVGGWAAETLDGTCCGGPSAIMMADDLLTFCAAYPDGSPSSPGGLRTACRSTGGGAWSHDTIDGHPTASVSGVWTDVIRVVFDRIGWGTYYARMQNAAWPKRFISDDHGRPDLARYANGNWGVVTTRSSGNIRFTLLEPTAISHQQVTSSMSDFAPEIVVVNGKARVIFNHAEGGTGDGIYVTKQL
ncbi:MAG: hypothetical protein QOH61_1977 [Chloroflexota bacterium]|jgi:hypothetical protein|nr:hypothetical protein [Chloroflexota bacterium]